MRGESYYTGLCSSECHLIRLTVHRLVPLRLAPRKPCIPLSGHAQVYTTARAAIRIMNLPIESSAHRVIRITAAQKGVRRQCKSPYFVAEDCLKAQKRRMLPRVVLMYTFAIEQVSCYAQKLAGRRARCFPIWSILFPGKIKVPFDATFQKFLPLLNNFTVHLSGCREARPRRLQRVIAHVSQERSLRGTCREARPRANRIKRDRGTRTPRGGSIIRDHRGPLSKYVIFAWSGEKPGRGAGGDRSGTHDPMK